MDNSGSSSHPYGYPNPNSNSNSNPYAYAYPPYPYPYPPPHPNPHPPHGPIDPYAPPPSTTPYSSYGSSYPQNSSHSFNYSNSYPPPNSLEFPNPQQTHAYPYPYPYQTPPIVSQSQSENPPHSSPYPPLNHLMSNVHLSDYNKPSAPHIMTHSYSVSNEEKKEEFHGHSSHHSFSGFDDSNKLSAFSGSFDDSVHSQSLQIVPVQNKGSLRFLLLHGNLDIWIHGAKNLPNMDMFHNTLGNMFGKFPGNASSKVEGTRSSKITSDPYVSISVSNAVVGRTFVISNSENPVWEQHFHVPVAHHAAEVHFVVKDSDVVGSQLIGIVAIPVEQIFSGGKVQGTYPILNNNGKPCKPGAVLSVSIQYIPMEKLIIYHQGVGTGPEYIGVPGTYFPLRKGGAVTLYQDAHVPDGCLPNVMLDHGRYYAHGQCWIDIFEAIRQAKRLVYITGWSVWHKVRLVRDAGNVHAAGFTLGDLLRSKSQEGVRVLLLVWDDPTSRSILGYNTVSNAIYFVLPFCCMLLS